MNAAFETFKVRLDIGRSIVYRPTHFGAAGMVQLVAAAATRRGVCALMIQRSVSPATVGGVATIMEMLKSTSPKSARRSEAPRCAWR